MSLNDLAEENVTIVQQSEFATNGWNLSVCLVSEIGILDAND